MELEKWHSALQQVLRVISIPYVSYTTGGLHQPALRYGALATLVRWQMLVIVIVVALLDVGGR